MGQKEHFVTVKPYLAHAVVATLSVITVPLIVVFGLLSVLEPDPPAFLSALVGVVLAIVVSAVGATIWARRPEAADIGFSDLMLWRWIRRRRAEEDLSHGARLLGLDRAGRPIDQVRITPEQQLQVLKDLTTALESKDPYTHGHSQRVERHCYRTAAAMGLAAQDIEDLRKAAALHDVGKIRIPDRILRKAGTLDGSERAVVEEHSVVGAWMVSSVGNADVIAAVRHHHERWDGAGYPDGLSGTDIPLFARVIAVSDAFDAITSTRPYRAGSGRDEAIEALRKGAGSQFDPTVVESFVAALPSRIPIAAGLFLALGGPQRIFRELAVWMRRFGAGTLSPAVGATGTAIVLGASMFSPSAVSEAPPLERRAAARTEVGTDPGRDRDERPIVLESPERERPTRKAPTRPQRERRPRPDRPTFVAEAPEEEEAPSGVIVSTNEPAPPLKEEPRKPPKPEPVPEPQPEPEPEPASHPSGNPNDGKDGCPRDGNAGKGNDERNCG